LTSIHTTAPEAYGYEAGEGDRLWVTGDTLTFKATAAQTGGSMTAMEVIAAPGGGPPPHVHANEDEAWYVLDGEFEILHGEETLRLTAGGFAFVPRGTVHRFENVSDRHSRVLIVFTPGGMDGFFFEAGVAAVNGESPPPLGPEEIERSREAAIRYGMEVRWPEPKGATPEAVNRTTTAR
jgi:quercetin dioxygenase-like cupin family protein